MQQTRLGLLLHAMHTEFTNWSKVPAPMTSILVRECEIRKFGALNGERCQEKKCRTSEKGSIVVCNFNIARIVLAEKEISIHMYLKLTNYKLLYLRY